VLAIRRWFDRAGPLPFADGVSAADAAAPPPRLPRRVLLDHYAQHVAGCRHCQKGLRIVTTVAVGAALAALGFAAAFVLDAATNAAAAAAAASTSLPSPALGWASWLKLAAAAAAALLARAAAAYRANFFFVDYDHRLIK
jgi:hypothetical protein